LPLFKQLGYFYHHSTTATEPTDCTTTLSDWIECSHFWYYWSIDSRSRPTTH